MVLMVALFLECVDISIFSDLYIYWCYFSQYLLCLYVSFYWSHPITLYKLLLLDR